MKIIMMSFILSIFISSLLIFLNASISIKNIYREKNTAFECGFDQSSMTRMPFSMQFFLIAMIFLIFDVEITVISPMPLITTILNINYWIFINVTFIVILILGTIHEWNEGSLNWTN